ncbi:MAG: alpha/beta hydrolase [Chitinophagaceae bacterium]|nr:alpha/beta hydrolase [Chitinophagaceae bacterium]
MLSLFFSLSQKLSGQYKVTMILNTPSIGNNADNKYFLSTETNSWKSGDTLYMFKNINGQLILSFIYNSKYFIQCKVNRGDNRKYECSSDGYGIANRLFEVKSDTTFTLTVQGWTDLIEKKHTASKNVKILFDSLSVKSLNTTKQISVYLPPTYKKSKKRYPVIYMNDGEGLFDQAYTDNGKEWKLDEALDSLNQKGKGEFIIIGISSGENRFAEYSPYATKKLKEPKGKDYLSFIISDLIPYVNKKFRTKTGPENTSIGGSSMGGLISFFAALEFPNVFGSAAVFSPAYWNSISKDSLKKEILYKSQSLKSKIFFYGGGAEGIQNLPNTLKEFQYSLSRNRKIKTFLIVNEEGMHQEKYWTEPFKQFVLWHQKN